MQAKKFPFEKVQAISGSGQQHGSTFWRKGASAILQLHDPSKPLGQLLAYAFARPTSPIWMDSSTTAYCKALEAKLGGALAVSKLTGSRAYERFTGNQIAKEAKENTAAYENCERISLISSMICSLFLGRYADIDYSDGSGMNLMNLTTRDWADECLAATAPDLRSRLGAVVPSHKVLGTVSDYFVYRYGFNKSCVCVAWSGDNPCSLAALGLSSGSASQPAGDVAISLGTSDTLFGITRSPHPGVEGHLFANPVDPQSAMAMLCFKNGSLTRQRVRDRCAAKDWAQFETLMGQTPPGNQNRFAFFIDQPEITPDLPAAGVWRFNGDGSEADAPFDAAVEVRCVVESQVLAMRAMAEVVGIVQPRRLVVTGGGSVNKSIVQVLADVFGVSVYSLSQPDSASLGAAYRALHGLRCSESKGFVAFNSLGLTEDHQHVADPNLASHKIYNAAMPLFTKALNIVRQKSAAAAGK